MFFLASLLFASNPAELAPKIGTVGTFVSAANAALKAGGHRTTGEWISQGNHRGVGEWLKQGNHRNPWEWLTGVPSRNKK